MECQRPKPQEQQINMDQSSLQQKLHAATRSIHVQLNKAVTARLPLCLPPTALSPAPYYIGILVFGELFMAFERGIEEVLRGEHQHSELVAKSQTPGLRRTEKLQQDLKRLRSRIRRTDYGSSMVDVVAGISQDAKIRMQTVEDSIQRQPHLVLAYQWTLYLALFNGGRYLQRMLAAAGPEFWLCEGDEIDNLNFWHFDAATASDPEANLLKAQFKSDLDEASKKLTEAEQQEVVDEAVKLFELCIELISHLDMTMAKFHTNSSRSSWKVWDTLRSTSADLQHWLIPFWSKRPMIQEVKEG